MKLKAIALAAGLLALTASPALAGKPDGVPSKGHAPVTSAPDYTPEEPDSTPGPKAGLPAKAKAYGRRCKGASKKHVKGEKGTEFSRCVTAMAKAANNERMSARRACKGLSKKHVKGEKGTEFSRCVKAAAQLKREERRKEREEKEEAASA